jgi:curli biogenesis system outer membrane secretion channel CsgG
LSTARTIQIQKLLSKDPILMEFKMVTLLGILASCFAGSCATQPTVSEERSVSPDLLPNDSGQKARIAVRKFEWRAGAQNSGDYKVSYTDGNGEERTAKWSVEFEGRITGLTDLLTDSLVNSAYFQVLERDQFEDTKEEVQMQEEGWVQEGSGPTKGQAIGADLGIYGAVTEWEEDAGGSSIGGGGFLPLPSLLGGAALGRSKGRLAITIRVYDLNSSSVLASRTIVGEASSWRVQGGALGFLGGTVLAGGLSQYESKPMGQAIRMAIAEAMKAVVNSTPKDYFRYS